MYVTDGGEAMTVASMLDYAPQHVTGVQVQMPMHVHGVLSMRIATDEVFAPVILSGPV